MEDKKNVITKYFSNIIFLVFALIFGNIILNPSTAFGAEKTHSVQSGAIETTGIDNTDDNDFFSGYTNKCLYSKTYGSSNFGVSELSQLNQYEKIIYDKLKDIITEIADGKRSKTEFDIGNSKFFFYDDFNELIPIEEQIKTILSNKMNFDKIINMLLTDCPYELYWHKKGNGSTTFHYEYEYDDTQKRFVVENITFHFKVASDYGENAGDNKYYTDRVDVSKVKYAQLAKNNADIIVNKYENLNDYEKLHAYLDEICKLVTYDTYAAENIETLKINNPWNIVSVFDGDNSTNVVCEGYSKAFAYLCEKSNFQNDIKCYIVTSKKHMWNIVTMEDGKNYIVDVTNCDGNAIGSPEQLFLAGAKGNVDNGYVFVNKNGNKYEYIYEDITKQIFPQSILEISDTDYRPKNELPTETTLLSSYVGKNIISGNLKYKIISTNGIISAQFTGVKKKVKNLVIPSSIKVDGNIFNITDVASSAMKNDKKLRKLTIGKNIEHIGNNAFKGCKNLKKIIFKTKKLTAKNVGNNAFKGIHDNARIIEA